MAISIPDRVIVFDYGEVISRSQSEADTALIVEAAGLESVGVDAAAFWAAYWAHREPLDEGTVSVPEYWERVAGDLGLTWTPAEISELWVRDLRSWLSVDPGTAQLLDELHRGGTRVALLSNAGYDYGDLLRRAPYSRHVERVFVSAELGLVKPDPEIYQVVAGELGIGFDSFVFIDNKPENIESFVGLGGTGHVFTGADELRAFLEGLAAESSVA